LGLRRGWNLGSVAASSCWCRVCRPMCACRHTPHTP
jgi:hypothetical protein